MPVGPSGDRSSSLTVPAVDIRRRRRDLWGMPALLVVAVLVLTAIGQNMRAHERCWTSGA